MAARLETICGFRFARASRDFAWETPFHAGIQPKWWASRWEADFSFPILNPRQTVGHLASPHQPYT